MSRHRKFLQSLLKPFATQQTKEGQQEEDLQAIAAKEQKLFPYEVLAKATNNFSPQNKLGEGGFGVVYRGRLQDGTGREVAVKKLSAGSRQGVKEFTNEAMLLSRVQHKNVVNLHGYYAAADNSPHQEKLLVYEYVPHESLDRYLFSSDRRELDWNKRYNIITGVARGLLYLHEDAHTTIIHRDIKASNILLDDKWVPKIADFGMARLYPEDQTHVNTRIAGTNGYMAPEYLMHGHLSTKADVFSFGVLILELISGQKNSTFTPQTDAQSLLEWIWRLHRKGQGLEVMDPVITSTASAEQVALCIHIGLLCTQADPKLRPDMRRVVVILSKKHTSTLEEPSRPGFPGLRYRRPRARNHDISRGTSHTSPSISTSASTSNTHTRTISSATISPRLPSRDKDPMPG